MYYWLSKGCPAEKLNLGVAAYGRSFTLSNESNSISIGTDTIGGGLGKNNSILLIKFHMYF